MASKAKSVRRNRSSTGAQFRYAAAVNVRPAGEILLEQFTKAVRSGAVPPHKLLQDLAARFQQILDGTPADKALSLKLRKGRPRTVDRQFRDQDIAWDVAELYAQRGRGTLDAVCGEIARHRNLSEPEVMKIYRSERRRRPEWFAPKKTKK